jgi:aminoglycoside 2'-N-acetyltransferase I
VTTVAGAALRTIPTADLYPTGLAGLRAFLDSAFGDGFGEEDWSHALGGVHVLATAGGVLVGHASVVVRRLIAAGRTVRTGYVEAVVVRADQRRRGHGSAVMGALEAVIRGAYELGALGATSAGAALYGPRGWRPWPGTLSVVAPDGGLRRTPGEEGHVYVLPVTAELDFGGDLACDWRDGDVW